jgi:hypothetical protein
MGIEVVAQDNLPKWDQAFGDLYAKVEQARAAEGTITPANKFRTTALADFAPGGIE